MTEPPKPPLPRWLPLAAATAVGVAGLAAAAAVAARRRPAGEEPAPAEEPPPPPSNPDPPRLLESLLGVLSAEKPAPSVRPPLPAGPPLPPENPLTRRFHVILLAIAAAVVWVWAIALVHDATADPICGPTDDSWYSSRAELDPDYVADLLDVAADMD